MKLIRGAGDRRLKRDVEDALAVTFGLDRSAIRVSSASGVVTLSGSTLTLADKLTAVRVVAGVYGVRAVANDLTVRSLGAATPTSAEIARTAVAVLGWNVLIPKHTITVVVDDGWLALEGVVNSEYEKHTAWREVHGITGVRGVTNNIIVRPDVCAMHPVDMNDEVLFPPKMRTH